MWGEASHMTCRTRGAQVHEEHVLTAVHDRERRGRAQAPAGLHGELLRGNVGIHGGPSSPSIPSVAMAYGETRGSRRDGCTAAYSNMGTAT